MIRASSWGVRVRSSDARSRVDDAARALPGRGPDDEPRAAADEARRAPDERSRASKRSAHVRGPSPGQAAAPCLRIAPPAGALRLAEATRALAEDAGHLFEAARRAELGARPGVEGGARDRRQDAHLLFVLLGRDE